MIKTIAKVAASVLCAAIVCALFVGNVVLYTTWPYEYTRVAVTIVLAVVFCLLSALCYLGIVCRCASITRKGREGRMNKEQLDKFLKGLGEIQATLDKIQECTDKFSQAFEEAKLDLPPEPAWPMCARCSSAGPALGTMRKQADGRWLCGACESGEPITIRCGKCGKSYDMGKGQAHIGGSDYWLCMDCAWNEQRETEPARPVCSKCDKRWRCVNCYLPRGGDDPEPKPELMKCDNCGGTDVPMRKQRCGRWRCDQCLENVGERVR